MQGQLKPTKDCSLNKPLNTFIVSSDKSQSSLMIPCISWTPSRGQHRVGDPQDSDIQNYNVCSTDIDVEQAGHKGLSLCHVYKRVSVGGEKKITKWKQHCHKGPSDGPQQAAAPKPQGTSPILCFSCSERWDKSRRSTPVRDR